MSVSSFGKPPPDMFEVVYGSPRCRGLRQTGAPYDTRPHLPMGLVQGTLRWHWAPFKLRPRAARLMTWLAALAFICSWIAFGVLLRRSVARAVATLVALNVVLTAPLAYAARIVVFNCRLREGIDRSLGKAAQAKAQWAHVEHMPELQHKAKLPFFTWKVAHAFHLVVLNDGSQELWNTTGDELNERLADELGLVGFVGGGLDSKTGLAAGQTLVQPLPVITMGKDDVINGGQLPPQASDPTDAPLDVPQNNIV